MDFFNRVPLLICAGSFVLLSGCEPAAAPAPTETTTEVPTATFTPTATDTPTITPTITGTFTATPTFTPTLPYNAPGVYYIYACTFITPSGSMEAASRIRFCITTVNVLGDRSMRFNVAWTFSIPRIGEFDLRSRWLSKKSDQFNPNIALADNLTNNYPPINVTGCIATDYLLRDWSGDCGGSFFFDPAKPGATSFIYFDTGYGIAIGPIVLLKIPPTPTITRTGTQKTATPTPTTNPNLSYNEPGTYWLYKCKAYPPGGNFSGADSVTFCLNTVVVSKDRTMKFNFTWKVLTSGDFIKPSDANNPNIFLADNLGNEYHFTQAGGCAASEFRFYNPGNDCNGWFIFPAAESGAISFRYVDDSAPFFLDGIVLAKE